MAQTLKQLEKQIETLQRQAEKLRAEEMSGVVSRIKTAIAHYGLTAADLGLGGSTKGKPGAKAKLGKGRPGVVKYSNGQGGTWTGRGPRPLWLREAIASGKAADEFLVAGRAAVVAAAAAQAKPVKSAKKIVGAVRAKPRTSYAKDGKTWTGMGPQPKWLKDLLAAGTPLADLAVAAA